MALSSGSQVAVATATLSTPFEFAGKIITLTDVSPAPHSQILIPPEDYRFRFSVANSSGIVLGGVLDGEMTIGPICPVEREGHPCQPTAEMFAARKVYVYETDRKTLVTEITPDANGEFNTSLPEGDFYVDMEHPRIGSISGVPATIHIDINTSATLHIDIDTGIR